MTLACEHCKTELPANAKSNRKFCTLYCAREHARRVWRERNPKSPLAALATGTVAEVNEMRVCIDLLSRGYEVYRAAFPAMPCDILVVPPNKGYTYRVEVTSGNYTAKGTLAHPKREEEKFDVLAVVLADGTIVYKPEL